MTIIDNAGSQLAAIPVNSIACSDVLTAINSVKISFSLPSGYLPLACSSQYVVPSSLIIFQNNKSLIGMVSFRVVEINAPSEALDYSTLGVIWAFGFTTIVALWMVSRSAGTILEAIRRF